MAGALPAEFARNEQPHQTLRLDRGDRLDGRAAVPVHLLSVLRGHGGDPLHPGADVVQTLRIGHFRAFDWPQVSVHLPALSVLGSAMAGLTGLRLARPDKAGVT